MFRAYSADRTGVRVPYPQDGGNVALRGSQGVPGGMHAADSMPSWEPSSERGWLVVVRGGMAPPARDPAPVAVVSLVAGTVFWVILLPVYLVDRTVGYDPDSNLSQLIGTLLFFLPYVGIVFAIFALRRARPYTRGSRRISFAKAAAWIGLLLGVAALILTMFAFGSL
jgi:F0F1-type ATP synthase assembly protein I